MSEIQGLSHVNQIQDNPRRFHACTEKEELTCGMNGFIQCKKHLV